MLFWNCNYIPSVEFFAKTECPRFRGEPIEIQTSQPHRVHVQWRGCICVLPLKSTLLFQPAPPRARSMARMHLRSTAEINASVSARPTACTFNDADASAFYRWNQRFCFCQPEHLVMLPHFSSVGSSVFHRYSVSSFEVLGSALTEVALLPATGLRSALQANSCCVKSFAPASPSLAHHPHEVPPLKRPHAANSYIVRYDYFLLVLHIAFREVSSGTQKKRKVL